MTITALFFTLEDPYYCGLRARVPNFAKSSKKSSKDLGKRSGLSHPASMSSLHQLRPGQNIQTENRIQTERNPALWHARSYESGIGKMINQYIDRKFQTLIRRPFMHLFNFY